MDSVERRISSGENQHTVVSAQPEREGHYGGHQDGELPGPGVEKKEEKTAKEQKGEVKPTGRTP